MDIRRICAQDYCHGILGHDHVRHVKGLGAQRLQVFGHMFKSRADINTDDPGPWVYVHRWTLARSLWEAGSSFEFQRMWTEKPQFIIANYSFENFLEYGRGEDVDDFAEILLNVSVSEKPWKTQDANKLGQVSGDRCNKGVHFHTSDLKMATYPGQPASQLLAK